MIFTPVPGFTGGPDGIVPMACSVQLNSGTSNSPLSASAFLSKANSGGGPSTIIIYKKVKKCHNVSQYRRKKKISLKFSKFMPMY